MVTYVYIFVFMANLASITTTSTAIVPAIDVRLLGGNYTTIVGSFSAELRGKVFSIIGGGTKLNFDLTADTVIIDGTSCTDANVMTVFNAEFVK